MLTSFCSTWLNMQLTLLHADVVLFHVAILYSYIVPLFRYARPFGLRTDVVPKTPNSRGRTSCWNRFFPHCWILCWHGLVTWDWTTRFHMAEIHVVTDPLNFIRICWHISVSCGWTPAVNIVPLHMGNEEEVVKCCFAVSTYVPYVFLTHHVSIA